MIRTISISTLVLALAIFIWPGEEPAQGADVTWDVTMKGKSATLAGQKFKFAGDGTMTWDQVAGTVSFNLTTPNGPWTGTGALVVAANGKTVYGVVDIPAGGAGAAAIFTGKLKKKGTKFSGKFQAASPERLGAAPDGFVLTTGKVNGEVQVQ